MNVLNTLKTQLLRRGGLLLVALVTGKVQTAMLVMQNIRSVIDFLISIQ